MARTCSVDGCERPPCPPGLECCHGNGDPSDNRLRNLRWDTRVENWADRKRHASARR